jgi:CRISPR-associated protein Cst1
VAAVAEVLRLTAHPVQRAGAWAAAGLAGRSHPDAMTVADLDNVAATVVADVVRAATAGQDDDAYGWWKVLFALYPNSKATHSRRTKDPLALTLAIADLFAPDDAAGQLRPCTFCAAASSVVWAKSLLPLFETDRAVNVLPPGVPGWPVCRACRLSMWTLPYGAWLTAGSATVLTCDEPGVERVFAERNLRRTARIRQLGFTGLPATASPELVTLQVLRRHGGQLPVSATLWMFKNDNQEPWLRVTSTRLAVAGFIRRLGDTPAARHGWLALSRSLTKRDKSGAVAVAGRAVLAKALFDPDGQLRDDLLRHLRGRAEHIEDEPAAVVAGWRALHRLYLKEMYGMDTDRLKPAAELITDWITAEPNPRGRFNEYRLAAPRPYQLRSLLMQAQGRLALDGREWPDISRVTPALLAGPDAGLLRGQLFFEVMAALKERGVRLGRKPGDDQPDPVDEDADPFGADDEEEGA